MALGDRGIQSDGTAGRNARNAGIPAWLGGKAKKPNKPPPGRIRRPSGNTQTQNSGWGQAGAGMTPTGSYGGGYNPTVEDWEAPAWLEAMVGAMAGVNTGGGAGGPSYWIDPTGQQRTPPRQPATGHLRRNNQRTSNPGYGDIATVMPDGSVVYPTLPTPGVPQRPMPAAMPAPTPRRNQIPGGYGGFGTTYGGNWGGGGGGGGGGNYPAWLDNYLRLNNWNI